MTISNLDLQINWLERNKAALKRIIENNGIEVQDNETLSQVLVRTDSLPDLRDAPEGMDPEYYRLTLRRKQLQNQKLKNELKVLWTRQPELPKENPPETESDTAALLPINQEETQNDYEKGFAYLKQKRLIAQKNGLRWLLEKQRKLLERLKKQAWFGKIAALGYGLGIGIGLAGYMTLTLGLSLISANLWLLPLVAVIAWFPTQQNFWISRRAPSELIFDMFTSPYESTSNYSWKRELVAKALGFCNAIVYGGLSAYGMWEFFTLAALNATPLGIVLCASATFILGMMVFLPELGLGIKFNREQLQHNPIKKLLASVQVGQDGKLLKPDADLDLDEVDKMSLRQLWKNAGGKFVWRFTWVFACVVVGTVFTTLAAAGMAASLTGLPFWGACTLLSFMALSLLPFYLDKAIKNATKLHDSDYIIQNPQEAASAPKQALAPDAGLWDRLCFEYPKITRCVNAAVNAVPAFLGGLGMLTGFGGIVFGLFTGFTGGVASFLSGEDGKVAGYENKIDQELQATNRALADSIGKEIPGAPTVMVDDIRQEATNHPLMFRPFHTTDATKERELHLLAGTLPVSEFARKKTKAA